jgi:hypothetical protein
MSEFNFEELPVKIAYVGEVIKAEWPHDLWRVEFSNASGFWSTDYKTGLGLRAKAKNRFFPDRPVKPTIRQVMESLLLDASAADQNFNDWCAEFGYSSDSINASNIYRACMETGEALNKYLGRETMAQIRAALNEEDN